MTIKYSVKSERIKYIQTLSLPHRVKFRCKENSRKAKYMTNKNEQTLVRENQKYLYTLYIDK